MKISKTNLIYIYAIALFLMTFLFAKRIMTSFKTDDFDYLKIIANGIIIVYLIFKIIKLGKEQNEPNNN